MGRKRNSFRERNTEGSPLPLSAQLAAATEAAPKEADGSVDYVKAWTADAVDPVGEDLGDVTTGLAEQLPDTEGNRIEYAETTSEQKAIIWLLKNDLPKASRWATALANEPERLIYDLFSEAELEYTGVDFAGDDFSTATVWAEDKYTEYLETLTEGADVREPDPIDTPENWSDDTLPVEPSTPERDPHAEEKARYYADLRVKHLIPDNWSDAAIDKWVELEGYNHGMTDRGNFVVDPTRFGEKGLDTYTTTELLDAIQGKLYDDYSDVEANIATIYRQREPVDAAWSSRDLIDFLQQGLEPIKVSTGAWKNDVTRARRMAQDWTTQELQAWVKGEITTGGETTDQKVAIEVNKRFDLGVVQVTPADIRRVYEKLHNNAVKIVGVPKTADTPTNLQPEPAPVAEPATVIPQGLTAMNAAYLKTQTERYATACKPGRPITAEAGAKEQRELDNLFRYILKIEDPAGFGNAMGFIRDFFKKNRDGLFDPQYAFRFTGTLRTEGAIQETHVNLLNILQVYTDDNKAARKQIDLPYLLSKFPAERQAWLLEFFQRYC
uniref:Virion structural protein n=1 Tax=Pseudomonas phage RVTF4 TaxID=3236931 RepID=A0AB39CD17_9VIRU